MFKKNSDVHALIMEQIKDVEKCLVSFEQFMRAATATDASFDVLKSLCHLFLTLKKKWLLPTKKMV